MPGIADFLGGMQGDWNNPLIRLGLSIMAQPGGMSAGQQIGKGVLEGLAGFQEQQQAQQIQQYRQQQIEMQRQEAEQKKLAKESLDALIAKLRAGEQVDPSEFLGVPGLEDEAMALLHPEQKVPKTVGGMQYNPISKQFEEIPGYAEQRARVAAAEAQERAKYREPREPREAPETWGATEQVDPAGRRYILSSRGKREYIDVPAGAKLTEREKLDADIISMDQKLAAGEQVDPLKREGVYSRAKKDYGEDYATTLKNRFEGYKEVRELQAHEDKLLEEQRQQEETISKKKETDALEKERKRQEIFRKRGSQPRFRQTPMGIEKLPVY